MQVGICANAHLLVAVFRRAGLLHLVSGRTSLLLADFRFMRCGGEALLLGSWSAVGQLAGLFSLGRR
jgi:hypothetical protein